MYEIERHEIQYDQGTAIITLHPDEDAPPPNEDGDYEPEFFRAERGDDLWREMTSEFGSHYLQDKAYRTMTSGVPYKTADGDWYFGITEYRHGGCALALCGDWRARRWPDQQWDVIALSGWVKISKKLRQDWGIFGKRGVEEKAKANAEGYVKAWDTYLNGGVVGYVMVLNDKDGKELEEESCWGYYEEEDAVGDARSTADFYAERLGWVEVKP